MLVILISSDSIWKGWKWWTTENGPHDTHRVETNFNGSFKPENSLIIQNKRPHTLLPDHEIVPIITFRPPTVLVPPHQIRISYHVNKFCEWIHQFWRICSCHYYYMCVMARRAVGARGACIIFYVHNEVTKILWKISTTDIKMVGFYNPPLFALHPLPFQRYSYPCPTLFQFPYTRSLSGVHTKIPHVINWKFLASKKTILSG